MRIEDTLENIKNKALNDFELRNKLLSCKNMPEPVSEFCRIAKDEGFEIYEMDLIDIGETFHAAMKRSTNGGGENSPMLAYQDDFFELFLKELEYEKWR